MKLEQNAGNVHTHPDQHEKAQKPCIIAVGMIVAFYLLHVFEHLVLDSFVRFVAQVRGVRCKMYVVDID